MPSAGSLPAALVVEEGGGGLVNRQLEGGDSAATNDKEDYISPVEDCSKF